MTHHKRIDWLDSAKGIGIILVVVGHVLLGLINAEIITTSLLTTNIRSVIYSFHMPLFFIIAGALFNKALFSQDKNILIINRLCIIFYPYILWSLLQGGLEILSQNHKNHVISSEQVYSLLWEPRAHFWFLYELFIFSIIAILFTVRRLHTFCITTIGLILYCSGDWGNEWGAWRYFKHNLVFFYLGLLIATPLLNWRSTVMQLWLLGSVSIGLQYFFHITLDYYFLDKSLLSFTLAILSCAFIFAACQQLINTKFAAAMALVGRHSLAIYLIHVIVLAASRIFLNKVLGIDDALTHFTIATLLAVLVPLGISLLAEKYHWTWLFRFPFRPNN